MKQPLGVINKNPLNMRPDGKSKWQGLASPPSMAVPGQGSYLVFDDPTYGWRAAALNLIAYQDRRGINTLRRICDTWAPASDNNHPLHYATAVSQYSGFGLDEPLDMHDYESIRPVIMGMAKVELGADPLKWYSQAQIDKGLVMAGVQPPKRSLVRSRTMAGSAMTGLGIVGESAQQASFALQSVADYSTLVTIVCTVLALGGLALITWARIDDSKRGLR